MQSMTNISSIITYYSLLETALTSILFGQLDYYYSSFRVSSTHIGGLLINFQTTTSKNNLIISRNKVQKTY